MDFQQQGLPAQQAQYLQFSMSLLLQEWSECSALKERELNPNTFWLRDAKWGFFTHYLPHNPSDKIPDHMTGDLWTKKVNSFNVKPLGRQLSELNAPFFFITIGQKRGWYCSPNKAFEGLFANDVGCLTERDLVQELADELVPRGIRMCVYLPNGGRNATHEEQLMFQQVIREWSERWGKSISAWWIDGGVFRGLTGIRNILMLTGREPGCPGHLQYRSHRHERVLKNRPQNMKITWPVKPTGTFL